MGSIIWDLPFSLMLGLKFVSNLIHTRMAEDLKVSKIGAYINTDGINLSKRVLLLLLHRLGFLSVTSLVSIPVTFLVVWLIHKFINRKQDAKYQVIEP